MQNIKESRRDDDSAKAPQPDTAGTSNIAVIEGGAADKQKGDQEHEKRKPRKSGHLRVVK